MANLASLLILVELFLHTTIAVILLGWGFGAQYWLFIIPLFVALTTRLSRWTIPILSAFCALTFIFLYYYTEVNPPLYFVPPLQLAVHNAIFIFYTITFLSTVVVYLLSETEQAETQLENEYQRSESLLQNVLPASIIERLKVIQGTIPDPSQTEGLNL